MVKRTFDFALAFAVLVLLAPVLMVIGLLVKLSSPGPVLYRARRVGRQGRLFALYKFRTMRDGADQMGAGITTRGDARVTPLGRWLRNTKLDELPQLINVLKGDMSLVGPRPEDPRYVALYTADQRRVLSVRPGMTSLASIQYRHEEQLLDEANLETIYEKTIMPCKLLLDLQYIERRSFWLDVRIILRTVQALFAEQPLA